MRKILSALLLCFLFLNVQAQDWYTQKLSDQASIDFPVAPEHGDTIGENIYTFINDTSFYLVSVRDLSGLPNFSLKPEELNKFQDEVIRGSVDACKGKLVSKQPFTINGLQGIDAVITSSEIIGLPDLRFKRVIFFNKTIYQFDFWVFADRERRSKADRDRFFNSLAISGDSSTLAQNTTVGPKAKEKAEESIEKKDTKIYMYAAIGMAALVALVFWLIRRKK